MAKTLFLGVEGSGKTTLAMALARAFARHRAAGWYLRPVDRGAYNFATIAPEDFSRDGFPRQTANMREMTWRIERDGEEKGALEVLDYPGEVYRLAFLSADDEPDPVAFRERAEAHAQEIETLRSALAAAARVFVLFNLRDAFDLRGNDANRSAVWVTNESLKAVKALPSKPQVTLVFTQVDRYQTADDFLHAFRPVDLDLIGHDHPDIDWAMVSVLLPPDGEFGIDAFVRRCTGLEDFGVPTGRPLDAAAATAGAALARLAEAQMAGAAEETPPAVVPPAAAVSVAAAPSPSLPWPLAQRKPLVVALVVGVGVLVLLTLVRSGARSGAAPAARSQNANAVVSVARPKDTNAVVSVTSPKGTNVVVSVTRPKGTNVVESVAPVESSHPSPRSEAMAKRIAAAAWAAWVKTEATRLDRVEAARSKFAEALKATSPQTAHEALCAAAEAGHAEAQYRLACVYDFWGWGAWVRTKEDRAQGWTAWLRRIDFEKGAKAVPVSRPAPNAEEYRKLALDWYRSAAAQGVAAAAAALARHGAAK